VDEATPLPATDRNSEKISLVPPGVDGMCRGGGMLYTLLFPGVEGASRRFLSGIIGGLPSLAIPTDNVELVLETPLGFDIYPLCPEAEFVSLCPASELAYLLLFFPNKPFKGLKKLLAILPTSLAAGVGGADAVPFAPVFVMGTDDEIIAADFVLVGGGTLLVWK
jgi:hypothetical protein